MDAPGEDGKKSSAASDEELAGKAIDVVITSTTFAKVANYFVAVQIDKGAKLRTEVSAGTEKPKFRKANHRVELGATLQVDTASVLTLGAFVVLPSKTGGKGNARLLGSVTYNLSDAVVRLVRGESVPEDLTFFRNAGPDRKIPVGKISVSLSLVGVGDNITAESVGPNARVFNVIVHSARNVSNEYAKDAGQGEQASTMVEARILTAEQNSLVQSFEQSRVAGLDGDTVDMMKELKANIPERMAETRVQRNNANPRFNEMMAISALDSVAAEGASLRLDIVQDQATDVGWPSLGGFSIPLEDIMAGHQYDLRVDYGTYKVAGKKMTSSLFVSIYARDSTNGEKAALKYAPESSRLEVFVKGFDDKWPFEVDRLLASCEIYSEESYARAKLELSKLANGESDAAVPIPPFGHLPLNNANYGPELENLRVNNKQNNSLLQSLARCTPIIKPLSTSPRFDFSFLFNIGLRGHPGADSYPDKGLPAAVIIRFFRQNSIEAFGGERADFLGDSVPCKFCGFSVLELDQSTHPDDGSVQAFMKDKIMLMAPGGSNNKNPRNGPALRITTRYWSGETFLRHMKEGDPLAADSATSGAAGLNWTEVSASIHEPNNLMNLAKAKDVTGFAKMVANAAVSEAENSPRVAKASGFDKDGTPTKENKTDADDPFNLLGSPGGAGLSANMNTPKPPPPSSGKTGEEIELAKLEQMAQGRLEESLSSTSNMVPTRPSPQHGIGMMSPGVGKSPNVDRGASDREVAQLHKRLAVITEDISHKQNLIDRLLKEVDKRSEAIRTCGVEIVQLRRANKQLENERNEAARQLKEMQEQESKEVENLAKSVDSVASSTPQELGRQLVSLSAKYKAERERNNQMLMKLKKLYEQASEVRHSRAHYEQLEKAHQAQAQYIQKLQQENQKIEVYKATIRTQEKVVAKLEELIESKLRGRKDNDTGATFRLKQEISRLTERNNELEKKLFAGGSDGALAIERVHELESQLKQLRARGGLQSMLNHEGTAETHAHKDAAISALESQLVENARGFAKQISDLKIKVMEASNGMGDDDDEDF